MNTRKQLKNKIFQLIKQNQHYDFYQINIVTQNRLMTIATIVFFPNDIMEFYYKPRKDGDFGESWHKYKILRVDWSRRNQIISELVRDVFAMRKIFNNAKRRNGV